jgi:uncharacterized lipoprotein
MLNKTALAALALLTLSACASNETREPVGIGSDYDELKGSPCACVEIPMTFPEPRARDAV